MNPTHILAASAAALGILVPGAAAQDSSYYAKIKPNLGLKVTPKRDRFAPFKYKAAGKLGLNGASGVACSGKVSLRVRKGARTVARGTTKIDATTCTYERKLKVKTAKLRGVKHGTLKVSARFGGNKVLQPDSASNRKVKFG